MANDVFLRRKMDVNGYLPVTFIASFPCVRALTNNISMIIEAIAISEKLELANGYKVRTRHDPLKWPLLDPNADSSIVNIEQLIPPPPPPMSFREHRTDRLNPNVAEFVPYSYKTAKGSMYNL